MIEGQFLTFINMLAVGSLVQAAAGPTIGLKLCTTETVVH